MRRSYEIVIEAKYKKSHLLRELWLYRELFCFLAWRDIVVRYKQTLIGIFWSILKPVLSMLIFTVIFGKLAKFSSGDIPYPLMVYAGLLPWYFFSNTVSESSQSVVSNRNMVTKLYFPRIILPTASMMVNFVDFFISFGILLILMLFYSLWPDWKIIFLFPLLFLTALTSLGISYFIAALSVKYRDFKYIVPFFVQFGLYLSPVGFQNKMIPERWRFVYSLNPMAGVIDGFRWVLLGKQSDIYLSGFLLAIIFSICIFFFGFWFFSKTERSFADLI